MAYVKQHIFSQNTPFNVMFVKSSGNSYNLPALI